MAISRSIEPLTRVDQSARFFSYTTRRKKTASYSWRFLHGYRAPRGSADDRQGCAAVSRQVSIYRRRQLRISWWANNMPVFLYSGTQIKCPDFSSILAVKHPSPLNLKIPTGQSCPRTTFWDFVSLDAPSRRINWLLFGPMFRSRYFQFQYAAICRAFWRCI